MCLNGAPCARVALVAALGPLDAPLGTSLPQPWRSFVDALALD